MELVVVVGVLVVTQTALLVAWRALGKNNHRSNDPIVLPPEPPKGRLLQIRRPRIR